MLLIVACWLARFFTEYLYMKGYFRGEQLPVKYTAVKPDLILKKANVLTEGKVDPAALQCKNQKAHLGAFISWSSDTHDDLKGATVQAISNEEFTNAFKGAKVDGVVTRPFTGRTSGLNEAQTVEVAWT